MPPTVSNSSSLKSLPKRSLNSAIGVSALTRNSPFGSGLDQGLLVVVVVVLVVDVADDLLEHVLDGDEAGDAAVLVDDDRHVAARAVGTP
jgi:hypothetical protein